MREVNFYETLFHVKLSSNEKTALEWMVNLNVTAVELERAFDMKSAEQARVFVTKLRRKLNGTGWKIATNKGGHNNPGTYRLERT